MKVQKHDLVLKMLTFWISTKVYNLKKDSSKHHNTFWYGVKTKKNPPSILITLFLLFHQRDMLVVYNTSLGLYTFHEFNVISSSFVEDE